MNRLSGPAPDDVVEHDLTYRRLAIRVIEQALRDMVAPGCGAEDRATAREFLSGSVMLLHWCNVAALDPRRVMATAVTLEHGTPRRAGGRSAKELRTENIRLA